MKEGEDRKRDEGRRWPAALESGAIAEEIQGQQGVML